MSNEGVISEAALGDEEKIAPIAPIVRSDEIAYEAESERSISRGKLVFIFSDGFPRPYKNDKEEIEELKKKPRSWMPHNDDIKETIRLTNGQCKKERLPCEFKLAKKIEEFFGDMDDVEGLIVRIVVYAHMNSKGIFLNQDDLNNGRPSIVASDLSKWHGTIGKIKKKFIKDKTTINLIGCNGALDIYFLQALANSFDVPIRAYGEEVIGCVNWNEADNKITCRGRVAPASSICTESDYQDCTNKLWFQGVKDMIPPTIMLPDKKIQSVPE